MEDNFLNFSVITIQNAEIWPLKVVNLFSNKQKTVNDLRAESNAILLKYKPIFAKNSPKIGFNGAVAASMVDRCLNLKIPYQMACSISLNSK